MKQAENKVVIEGYLNALDMKDFNSNDGRLFKRGTMEIAVPDKSNGNLTIVPVKVFLSALKKDGKPNKAFENMNKIEKEWISIAACGNTEMATKVSISSGQIVENAFIPDDSNDVVSSTEISSMFFNKVTNDFEPNATFQAKVVIGSMAEELDNEGTPTGRMIIKAMLVQYNDKIDVVQFVVANPEAIKFIERSWKETDTVRIAGKVNYSVKREKTVTQMGFGEPVVEEKTRTVKEFIITSGSEALDIEEGGYNPQEIQAGLQDRKRRLVEDKEKRAIKNSLPSDMSSGFMGDGNGFNAGFGNNRGF